MVYLVGLTTFFAITFYCLLKVNSLYSCHTKATYRDSMTKYDEIYQRFLNLSRAIDQSSKFPSLTPDEKSILRCCNDYWIDGQNLTVVEAMNVVPTMSTSTVFRYLKKLRQKGFIELEIDESDNRVKYIRPTKLTKIYFSEHGKIISSLLAV